MTENPKRHWLKFRGYGLLLLMNAATAPLGCGMSPWPEVEFVLPVGFRGQFAIVESPDGLKPREHRGKTVIPVQAPLTKLATLQPLEALHRETVTFADGKRSYHWPACWT